MKNTWQHIGWGVAIIGFMLIPSFAFAKVSVTVNGQSNFNLLYGHKGPTGIDTKIKVSRSAGSIATAAARAIFHNHTVNIGNKVVSAGTDGDDYYTTVRAGSLFFGKAKFNAVTPRSTVRNFKINYKVDGSVECFTPDVSVPEDYAWAKVESQIRFNDHNKFAGTETVDGVTGDDGGTGDFVGKFSGDPYQMFIDHTFKVNLGTLRDGRSYPLLFFGATEVGYDADVEITDCAANFMNTSKFSVGSDTTTQKGIFKITPAKELDGVVDPQPWDLNTTPDVTVYVESGNETFLGNIDVNQVQLFERLGGSGSVQPSSILDVGDFDGDGIPDRGIVFDGSTLAQVMEIELMGLKTTPTMYVIGETTAGKPFISSFQLETSLLGG